MRRFERQLEELQTRLLEMGSLVESAIHDSVSALMDRDEAGAYQVLARESAIDAMEVAVDDLAMDLLALYQPAARDMRRITASIKINNDLERIGDLAAHIAERAISLMKQPPLPLSEVPRLARMAAKMVHDSLDALVSQDADLARNVLISDDAVDRLQDTLYVQLISSMTQDASAVSAAIHLLFVIRHLERIADHATNIGEDVLFYLRGVDVRHHNGLDLTIEQCLTK